MVNLDARQVGMVVSSWQRIEADPEAFSQQFYRNLFEINPELESLFRRSLKMQGLKLVNMLGAVVESLHEPARMMPMVCASGARHSDYKVRPEHFDDMIKAWQETLAVVLADEYTVELAAAWNSILGLVCALMKGSMYSAKSYPKTA